MDFNRNFELTHTSYRNQEAHPFLDLQYAILTQVICPNCSYIYALQIAKEHQSKCVLLLAIKIKPPTCFNEILLFVFCVFFPLIINSLCAYHLKYLIMRENACSNRNKKANTREGTIQSLDR